jgi:hypothetical protein
LREFSAPVERAAVPRGFLNVCKIFEGGHAMGQTIVYVLVSLVVCIAYFTAVDHFLMDSQGLDFWYLFRK